MALVELHCSEWYPVYTVAKPGDDPFNVDPPIPTELPDELVEQLSTITEEFLAVQMLVRSTLKRIQQEREEAARRTEVEARRAERGQRRPKRRARPQS